MSNPFTSLWHFLERLFGKAATEVEWLLKQVNQYIPQIDAVVSEISAIAQANPNNATNAFVAFLQKFGKTEDQAKAFLAANAGLTGGDLLHSIASEVVASFFPAGTATNIINFGIELAYGVFKRQAATAATPTSVM